MRAMLDKVIAFLTRKEILFGVCRKASEKTGIKVALIRVIAIFTVLFISYKLAAITYLIGGLLLHSPQEKKPAEEKTEAE